MYRTKTISFGVLLLTTIAAIAFLSPVHSHGNLQDKGLPPKAGTPPPSLAKALGNPANSRACTSLTPAAIQQVLDAIDQSKAKGESDFNHKYTTGDMGVQAKYNLDYLIEARTKVTTLQNWLKANNLASPFVSNASAAYNVHGYMRDVVDHLGVARYHAMASGVYHNSVDASASFDLSTRAIGLADAVGAQGGRCYMSTYIH